MKIGLFDLYSSGHHLPYANKIKEALSGSSKHDVQFITLCQTELQSEFFDPEDIIYLDPKESHEIEERDRDFTEIADQKISKLASFAAKNDYDVIHFLYIDDILGPIWRHWPIPGNVAIIGDLIGPFFTCGTLTRGRFTHQAILKVLQSPFGPVLDYIVSDTTKYEVLWRDLLLYRCLNDKVFDQLILHSSEAETYVKTIGPSQSTNLIPFEVPANFSSDISQAEARKKLDLPSTGPILLFFGTLRNEKGINILLDAMQQYSGPEFTLLIAGPPVSVDRTDIDHTDQISPVNIVSVLDYITDPKPYFRAADVVLMPYTSNFGKENMSMIFQEACGSLRPIIAPDSGVLGRLTEEWDLGETFEQNSAEALADTVSIFLTEDAPFSESQMKQYARQHNKERTRAEIIKVYEKLDR